MKIIYMGTPDFAVKSLEHIFNEGYDIPLVVTQMDKKKGRGKKLQPTPVKEKAIELGIEVFQPVDINSDESYHKLKIIEPDFIVVAAYGQILKKRILEIPKYNCLNIHASLLPKYRGAAPINWAIMNGEINTGITIMNMEEGLDTGGIFLKQEIPIAWEDDSQTIHDKLAEVGSYLVIEAMELIVSGDSVLTPQKHEESSYAPILYKGVGSIDWTKAARDIYKKVMGLKPWPSAFTEYKGQKIKIHRVEVEERDHDITPGTIVDAEPDGIKVAVSDGFIIIKQLQFPGKRAMNVKELLLGKDIEKGYIL
ncbi:methionyl-tRNA formyltransferase [Gudongella sp. DL1XJH-153]|uniref:methionyl-tRNA formyltransferase n=1 Tax=Gudongella sp. DL1XJH-153 TaxID=3409804 RepID=UPI003BB4AE8F